MSREALQKETPEKRGSLGLCAPAPQPQPQRTRAHPPPPPPTPTFYSLPPQLILRATQTCPQASPADPSTLRPAQTQRKALDNAAVPKQSHGRTSVACEADCRCLSSTILVTNCAILSLSLSLDSRCPVCSTAWVFFSSSPSRCSDS